MWPVVIVFVECQVGSSTRAKIHRHTHGIGGLSTERVEEIFNSKFGSCCLEMANSVVERRLDEPCGTSFLCASATRLQSSLASLDFGVTLHADHLSQILSAQAGVRTPCRGGEVVEV